MTFLHGQVKIEPVAVAAISYRKLIRMECDGLARDLIIAADEQRREAGLPCGEPSDIVVDDNVTWGGEVVSDQASTAGVDHDG